MIAKNIDRGEQPARTVRVAVIDDHRTFAELLAAALNREPDLDCVGTSHTVASGVDMCAALSPDLVVLDYRLPDGDGLQAAELILAQSPTTRILMLTGDPTVHAIERAAAIGVSGFLPKDGELSILLDAIRTVRADEFMVAPALVSRLNLLGRKTEPMAVSLTARESEVLQLMAEGQNIVNNAQALGISAHTCRGYVKSILTKLNAHSQLEAVATATKLGILGND